MLEEIYSNRIQKFKIKNSFYICEPYGIVTLEELFQKSKDNISCRKSIVKLYKKFPYLKYYVLNHIYKKQLYHIEFKNDKCIVYSDSEISLSEKLLRNGLALKKESLKDKEFNYYFDKAQNNAKFEKKGLWKEDIFNKSKALLR